ncbi:hypothetical protein TNCV_1169601 [Trichonephila clavipes]|uniref:Uncharacterized protein n=1 Tax=Trichonephila clavipes TaxID=2585209 RepID=A0A8X6T715_TRICX|nr:hypothetical protein TNCV_1169601 [Trichonephila clavipes]
MRYSLYKIRHSPELLDRDKPQRFSFAVSFLNRTVHLPWLWNILRSNEAHFYLNGTVNTQNYRIWAEENPGIHIKISLQSPKVTVCYLKSMMYLGGVATLNDSIMLHVPSITTDQLRSVFKHTVHRLEILEGVRLEPLSLHRPGND